MPTTYDAFGLLRVETLACRTPLVATREGAQSTILRDGENGALIPWRDPRLFADRIRAILNDQALATRLQRGALETARTYSWDGVAERTLSVYDDLVGQRISRVGSAE
jgi:D-inositol-3-phosphate glycosyltransferase